jgi:pyridoxamine 5'-phosphate oxidase
MLSDLIKFLVINMTAKYSLAFIRQFRTGVPRAKALTETASRVRSTSVESQTHEQTQTFNHMDAVAMLRKEYSQMGLDEKHPDVLAGPFVLFKTWISDAIRAKSLEPNAMCLSTCANNIPSARFVLLKDYNERGFVWFTNYESRKSTDLDQNPHAAITFWWGELERQVRIEGLVERVSDADSTEYFHLRPRGSQIGAWASHQSQTIDNREELEKNALTMLKKFEKEEVIPRPTQWGGWRLIPKRMEFWKGRQCRLHDRILFERDSYDPNAPWRVERLQP